MSEYQYIAFRAIDGPVSEKNLQFMRQQSSRAEVTRWKFDNEYHFGDFGGDAPEMLRRGYDVHLHYANFGVRTLMIRLPHGLPDPTTAQQYLDEDGLDFVKDKQGTGGILRCDPYFEAGDLAELRGLDDVLDSLLPLRAEILQGDLRPLYLLHLAVACDGNHDPKESTDGPVPAGLAGLTNAQSALADSRNRNARCSTDAGAWMNNSLEVYRAGASISSGLWRTSANRGQGGNLPVRLKTQVVKIMESTTIA